MRKKKKLGRKAWKCLQVKEAGKASYAEADALLDEICATVKPGEEIELFDRKGNPAGKVKLVDQFAEKTIVWKPCGVRRYELKVIT